MIIKSKLLKSTFFFGLGNVLPQVIGFFLIPLYTIYLSPTDYGIVDLAASISGFLTPLMRLGVPGSVTRFYFDYKNDKTNLDNYITSIYYLLLGTSSLLGIIFSGVYFLWGELIIPELLFYPYILLVVIASVLSSNSDIQRRLIVARGQAIFSAKLTTVFSLTSIALTLLLVIVFKLSAVGVILAQTITSLLFFIHAQYYLHLNLAGKIRLNHIKESLNYGIGLLPHHLFVAFAPLFSKFVLADQGSLASLGILAIAMRFTLPLDVLYNAFIPSFHPLYFEERKALAENYSNSLRDQQKQIIGISIVIYIFYSLVVPILIPFVVDSRYDEAASLISILGLGFVGKMLYANFIVEVFYSKKTKWVSISTLLGLAVTVVLSVLLIEYGAKGIAYAGSIGYLTWAAIALLLSKKLKSPANDYVSLIINLIALIFSFVIIELTYLSVLLKMIIMIPLCGWLLWSSKSSKMELLVRKIFNK